MASGPRGYRIATSGFAAAEVASLPGREPTRPSQITTGYTSQTRLSVLLMIALRQPLRANVRWADHGTRITAAFSLGHMKTAASGLLDIFRGRAQLPMIR